MIPYLNRILGGLLIISLALLTVQSIRLDGAQDFHKEYVAEVKDSLIDAYKQVNKEVIVAEQAQSKLDVVYQRGRDDAKKLADAVAADLSSDNERLRSQWRSALRRVAAAEATAADSGGDEEARQLRQDIEGFVLRAAEGDAKVVRLQDRIDGYLKQINGVGWYEQYGNSYRVADSFRTEEYSFGVREHSQIVTSGRGSAQAAYP